MRPLIVIGTSVFIAALRSRKGASHKLLLSIGKGEFEVAISVPLVVEYEAVAKRCSRSLGLTAGDIDDIIDYICSVGKHTEVHYLWRPALKDPTDDMVLELAVAAGSKHIITFNQKDFAGTDKFGIETLTPGEFIKGLGGIG